ncbi:MAG: aminotransferase class V-fold PLP-dependent enzyme, partial [Proteobacteria bacterium]|nr:aminotransferase class V-fold PLP-dependent enzyme [Pseudomonadota bacterium]
MPENTIYLDGNSLGALPNGLDTHIQNVIRDQWGSSLIRSWNDHNWMALPARVGEKIARLIGAAGDEVIACDSTSLNLFKLLVGACRARPGRRTILMRRDYFPTDLYIAQGVSDLLGERCEVALVGGDEIAGAIDDDTAVVAVTQVDFRTGRALDLKKLCETAHERGALLLCDLSHSAGVMPIDLNALGVDLATGCGYKYLNGGPGAPAYLFVATALQATLKSPIWGWMGHASPFEFSTEYAAAGGVRQFLAGTPAISGLAALDYSLEISLAVSMD